MDQLELPSGPPPTLRRSITMAFNCTQCGTLTSDSIGYYDYPEFCGSCVEKAQMDELKQSPLAPTISHVKCSVCQRFVHADKVLRQSNAFLCDIKCRKTFFKSVQKQAKDELNSRSISNRDLVECQTCHKLSERHKSFARADKYFCSFKCCLQDGGS